MEIPKVYICILDNDGVIEIADYVIANHIDEVKDLYDMCDLIEEVPMKMILLDIQEIQRRNNYE